MQVSRRTVPSVLTALLLLSSLTLALPAAAQQGGGGGGGQGDIYADLMLLYRDVNGVPFTIEVEGEHGTAYCVQPITTEAVPNPYNLLEGELPEFEPTLVNPVDGRTVTLVPLFAHYPEFLPEEDDDHAHALAPPDGSGPPDEHDEGGEPCDPLVIDEVHDYGVYAQEVELERLNLARSPDHVLERHLGEVELLLSTTDPELVTLDAAGRPVFDGAETDAMPKLQAIRQSLLETGTLPGADAPYPFPFRLANSDFAGWDTFELSAFALGGAASKFGSLNVDSVAYHDRIMGIPTDWLEGSPAGWPPQLHTYAADGELFVDYSDVRYSRAETFPGCVTYLDPANWWAGFQVKVLADVVPFADPLPNTDAQGVLANVAGYAQMADDARAVILFIHNYDAVIADVDPVGLESCDAQIARLPELNDPPDLPELPSWTDLSTSNVHYGDVLALAIDGIMLGFPDGTFRPSLPVSRGQVATVLARAGGLGGVTPATPSFSDIAHSPHAPAIEALVLAGVIDGFPDGTFRPEAPVRRDQAASLIGRWLGVDPVPDGAFTDVPASSVHAGYINALADLGVITGRTPTTFEPLANIRRDQFAGMVNRAR